MDEPSVEPGTTPSPPPSAKTGGGTRLQGVVAGYSQSGRAALGPGHPLLVDGWDPISRFIRRELHWEWPQVLLFSWLIFGPFEKLLLPGLLHYLNLAGPIRTWVPDVEALLTGFVEFPFFLAYYIWTSQAIGWVFLSLREHGNLADPAAYDAFLGRVQASFDQGRWTAISLAAGLAAVLMGQFVLWGPGAVPPPWWAPGGWIPRVVALCLIGLVAYAVCQVILRELLAARWLARLWHERGADLRVHPYHADGAGGLGAIGHHAANFCYFVIVAMLFAVMASVLPALRSTGPVEVTLWSPLIIVLWLAYLTLIPLILAVLVWPAHREMQDRFDGEVNRVSREIDDRLEQAAEDAHDRPEDLAKTLGAIDELQKLRDRLVKDYPTWPLSAQTRLQLRFSTAIPFAYSVLTALLDLLAKVRKIG